ncbi:hypothetical protein V8G54_027410 [Vigna mungo]|uniref:Uncharacterized protein n=1 Tax=Vigna mungo TaxID=3915 RepID=A0AAQ3N2S9_VIGMU
MITLLEFGSNSDLVDYVWFLKGVRVKFDRIVIVFPDNNHLQSLAKWNPQAGNTISSATVSWSSNGDQQYRQGAASHGGGSCWHPKLLVAEPGQLSASAVCTGSEFGSCVKKRKRGRGNPCLRATPNQKLTREIILPEVVFRVDDGVVRWGRRHVSSGFNKRPTLFMTVKTRSGTRGFVHRARKG